MRFFVGLHMPSHAQHFEWVFMSVNRLRQRVGPWVVKFWILDSGAFTEISRHGRYRLPVQEYADQINRWADHGQLLIAVAQDWMCEPHILRITGCTVRQHQAKTIQRFDALARRTTQPLMPVLQGYEVDEYLEHLEAYEDRLPLGAWVGVGSVCKRNARPEQVLAILSAIKHTRPDLHLHGFGLKITALAFPGIADLLVSSDSMAWSRAAYLEGRDANDWREAKAYERKVISILSKVRATDHFFSSLRVA